MDSTKVKASDHESYNTYTLISFLIPIVGIIMGAIMLTKDQKIDKKLGEHAIVVSIMGFILWGILWALYVNWVATQSITY